MKLDLSFIKEILEYIEENHDGNNPLNIKIPIHINTKMPKGEQISLFHEDSNKSNHHLGMLRDMGMIHLRKTKLFDWSFYFADGLTFEGHQLLDALRDENLLKKITNGLGKITIGTIEKIPALGIGAILKSMA